MELSRLAVFLCLIGIISFARCQNDCPVFDTSLLGSSNAASTTGLVSDAFGAIAGEGAMITVQVHSSNIVCLASGQTRDTYSGVSVVVSYTCSGFTDPMGACNGNPTLSQFEFGCASSLNWAASVCSIITFPSNGSLSTTERRDCGSCVSPARSGFANVTNNEQHCGSCNGACIGLRRCFNVLETGCCNFYNNDMCVISCPSPLVSNSNFDCVHDCPLLTIGNGTVNYQPQGTPPLVGATATYECNSGYTLNGNEMRTCQDANNGSWTGSDPSCDPVDCGTLTPPSNGMLDLPGTTFGQVATYRCNDGYERDGGDTTRTCQASSTWSGSALTCALPCPQCLNDGTCNVITRMCDCPSGFTGNDCSEMVCPSCNAGTCDSATGTCMCPPGFTGSDCSVRLCVPECVNGNCVDGVCNCSSGYVGRDCSVSCSLQIANCTQCRANVAGHFTCEACLPGYNLQGNECKSPCDVRFCKTCGNDSFKCMECNVGYEVDASMLCIVGETGSEMASSSDVALIAIVIAAVSLLTSIATVVILVCTMAMFLRKNRRLIGSATEAGKQMEMKQNVAYATRAKHTSRSQDVTYDTVT